MRGTKRKPPKNDPQAAYDAALRLLARREHSPLELHLKLEQRGFSAETIKPGLEQLREQGYLSESRFAESFARHRLSQGYGELRIRAELRQHALGSELIGQALEALGADWHALAAAQVRRHFGAVPDEPQARQRVLRYLTQRGFPSSAVREALSRGSELGDGEG
jgi:regulatory protein